MSTPADEDRDDDGADGADGVDGVDGADAVESSGVLRKLETEVSAQWRRAKGGLVKLSHGVAFRRSWLKGEAAPAEPAVVSRQSPTGSRVRRRPGWLWAVLAVGFVAVGSLVAWSLLQGPSVVAGPLLEGR